MTYYTTYYTAAIGTGGPENEVRVNINIEGGIIRSVLYHVFVLANLGHFLHCGVRRNSSVPSSAAVRTAGHEALVDRSAFQVGATR
eukprot:2893738-Pyramimonas_sp.AAC.1